MLVNRSNSNPLSKPHLVLVWAAPMSLFSDLEVLTEDYPPLVLIYV